MFFKVISHPQRYSFPLKKEKYNGKEVLRIYRACDNQVKPGELFNLQSASFTLMYIIPRACVPARVYKLHSHHKLRRCVCHSLSCSLNLFFLDRERGYDITSPQSEPKLSTLKDQTFMAESVMYMSMCCRLAGYARN